MSDKVQWVLRERLTDTRAVDAFVESVVSDQARRSALRLALQAIEFEPRPYWRGWRAWWRSLRCSHRPVLYGRCMACGRWLT